MTPKLHQNNRTIMCCQERRIMSHESCPKYWVLSPPYSDFQVTKKLHLQGTKYLPPIFTKLMQVAAVHHVTRCTYIHSSLLVKTEFRLLERQYLWLATTGGALRMEPGPAETVTKPLYVESFASKNLVLAPPTRTCK